jgi:putative ABC transport system ATP-binding protein
MELFQRLNKEKGMTILQVTHSEQCAEYGTRIVRIEDGKTIG